MAGGGRSEGIPKAAASRRTGDPKTQPFDSTGARAGVSKICDAIEKRWNANQLSSGFDLIGGQRCDKSRESSAFDSNRSIRRHGIVGTLRIAIENCLVPSSIRVPQFSNETVGDVY